VTIEEYPPELHYTSEHEWARLEGSLVRVGITHYAQDALGDVVYVELPGVGTRVTQDAPFGEIQSPKAVSDLYAPVTGEIVERNSDLDETPELVNDEPYTEGWLVGIQADDPAEVDGLMDATAYEEYVESLKEEA
jgi:glycine cleavage system H protein